MFLCERGKGNSLLLSIQLECVKTKDVIVLDHFDYLSRYLEPYASREFLDV